MAVTFGTRSAMRELGEELAPGEQVVELAACTYAGASGLLALTTMRVIAIRDDYSKHQVYFVTLPEVATLDYDPTVHDGFALFTAEGRLVVRKMRRADGDRLVDALLARAPHIVVKVTRPVPGQGAPSPVPQRALGSLGRHRRATTTAQGPASAPQPTPATEPWATTGSAMPEPKPAFAPLATTAPSPAPAPSSFAAQSVAAQSVAAQHVGDRVSAAVTHPAPSASAPAEASAARGSSDKEVLLSVLADLHAQGVLTADEFAAKVRQIVVPTP